MGLTGMIIVDDGTDARLGLPQTFGTDDLPLILQDRSFASDGSIEYQTDGSISCMGLELTPLS